VYKIPLEDFRAEELFNSMEKEKRDKRIAIADWGIS